jgi:hypothetical protein
MVLVRLTGTAPLSALVLVTSQRSTLLSVTVETP